MITIETKLTSIRVDKRLSGKYVLLLGEDYCLKEVTFFSTIQELEEIRDAFSHIIEYLEKREDK